MTGDSTGPRAPARVLIVDDSPTALWLLQAVFQHEQYDVVTAVDGNDGFEKACRCRPDLVVTDSVMPGSDGVDFVRKLRTHPETGRIPIIMLTAEEAPPARGDDTQPGPDASLKKSADMGPLLALVKDAIARTRPAS